MSSRINEKSINTVIYAGFPGVGKSYFFNNSNNLVVSDSDSSQFSWIIERRPNGARVRNPEFPNNYIKHIKSLIGKVDIIFTSTHKEVIDAMIAAGIDFTIVYPSVELKDEYLKRYRERGSDDSFIGLLYPARCR